MSDYKVIKLRSDSVSAWAAANPVLQNRELAYAIDGNGMARFKRGDGVTAWNSLPWITNVAAENPDYPNYLHNWYFANPVNQRGASSYTGPGPTIDRWKASSNMTVERISNGIRLTTGSGAGSFSQAIEQPFRITARQVTVSVDIISAATANFSMYFAYGENFANTTSGVIVQEGATGIKSFTVTVPGYDATGNNLALVIRGGTAAATIGLRAIKLELGNRCTLTNDSIAEYTEQENICRRFLIPLAKDTRYRAEYIGSTTLQFLIPVTNYMRVAPTIEDTSALSIRTLSASTTGVSIASVSVLRRDPAILISVNTGDSPHGLSDGLLYITTATYLNAELMM